MVQALRGGSRQSLRRRAFADETRQSVSARALSQLAWPRARDVRRRTTARSCHARYGARRPCDAAPVRARRRSDRDSTAVVPQQARRTRAERATRRDRKCLIARHVQVPVSFRSVVVHCVRSSLRARHRYWSEAMKKRIAKLLGASVLVAGAILPLSACATPYGDGVR